MEAAESPREAPPEIRKKKHTWRNTAILSLVLLGAGFGVVFYLFNHYGEKLLRNYLQEKVSRLSDGVYQVDFRSFNVNILTGKVSVDSFSLIPDTNRYNQLKRQGRTSRALYRISFASMQIDKLHFWQIWGGNRINFRYLLVDQPLLRIVGFPDTAKVSEKKWQVFYEDIYPTVSGLLKDFHIDSVKVVNGAFLASIRERTGKSAEGEYNFSATLRDVSVNPFSYYNPDRVFYSREVDLVIHNFEYQLANKLYTIRAGEIGFSLTGSVLYGKKISMIPDMNPRLLRRVKATELYHFELPSFSITGVDLYKVLTGRTVDIDSVNLQKLVVKVFHNQLETHAAPNGGQKGRIDLASLWNIAEKELQYIRIRNVHVDDGSFAYYAKLNDRHPEVRAGKVFISMEDFLIDSLSYFDKSRIFYSKGIELEVQDFSLAIPDKVHYVDAWSVLFSTKRSLIDVNLCMVWADRKGNENRSDFRRDMLDLKVPRLTFTGIDLKKVFNRRILDFDRLTIAEPDVRFTDVNNRRNPDPRFRNPEDFFQEANENVVYDLIKSYLWVVKGKSIGLTHGYAQVANVAESGEIPVASVGFDLGISEFLIDSVHGMNRQGYFYSNDFDLDLHNLTIASPDSNRKILAEHIHVITADSLIVAKDFRIRNINQDIVAADKSSRPVLFLDFSLDSLRLSGLNHRKLFLEKRLTARQIILENPRMKINSAERDTMAVVPSRADTGQLTSIIRSFEIGSCQVNSGSFSYDGEGDRIASYFSMRDIDFAVVNARVDIPVAGIQEGLIRFDSLQLNIFPIRAILNDSAYQIEAQSLDIRSYPVDITLKGISVIPLQPTDPLNETEKRVHVKIPEVRCKGFYFDQAIFQSRWRLDSIAVVSPSLHAELFSQVAADKNKTGVNLNPDKLFTIPVFMKMADITSVRVHNADLSAEVSQNGTIRGYGMENLMIEIDHFHMDSATGLKPEENLFNARDIRIAGPGFSRLTSDSMYVVSFSRFGLSTRTADARIDSVRLTPVYDRQQFVSKAGKQVTRMELSVPQILLNDIDLRALLQGRYRMGCLEIPRFEFSAWLDKRIASDTLERPPMPQELLRSAGIPVSIDSVIVHDGRIVYEEQEGAEPGRIWFDRVKATVTSPSHVSLHGTARLMGTAGSEVWFNLYPGHPRDSFDLKAVVDSFDLRGINPMLEKLIPVSIRSGTMHQARVVDFHGNDSITTGMMEIRYNNLNLKLHPVKPGFWPRAGQAFLSEVVNLFLPLGNPGDDGKLRQGVILNHRDPSRGFFFYIWKSLLSGIKSSAGRDTKDQKKIKKSTG